MVNEFSKVEYDNPDFVEEKLKEIMGELISGNGDMPQWVYNVLENRIMSNHNVHEMTGPDIAMISFCTGVMVGFAAREYGWPLKK